MHIGAHDVAPVLLQRVVGDLRRPLGQPRLRVGGEEHPPLAPNLAALDGGHELVLGVLRLGVRPVEHPRLDIALVALELAIDLRAKLPLAALAARLAALRAPSCTRSLCREPLPWPWYNSPCLPIRRMVFLLRAPPVRQDQSGAPSLNTARPLPEQCRSTAVALSRQCFVAKRFTILQPQHLVFHPSFMEGFLQNSKSTFNILCLYFCSAANL